MVDENKVPKIEYEVAKYLRNMLPEKKTTLMGHKVDYFIGETLAQDVPSLQMLATDRLSVQHPRRSTSSWTRSGLKARRSRLTLSSRIANQ